MRRLSFLRTPGEHTNFPCGAVVAALVPNCGTSHFIFLIILFLSAFFSSFSSYGSVHIRVRSGKQKADFWERSYARVIATREITNLRLPIYTPAHISVTRFRSSASRALSSSILRCYAHRAVGMWARLAFWRPLVKISHELNLHNFIFNWVIYLGFTGAFLINFSSLKQLFRVLL